jgi:hypothetical protein
VVAPHQVVGHVRPGHRCSSAALNGGYPVSPPIKFTGNSSIATSFLDRLDPSSSSYTEFSRIH